MVKIGDKKISADDFYKVLISNLELKLDEEALRKVYRSHYFLKEFTREKLIYGINTGFGPMAQYRINHDDQMKLQYNLIRSHCSGSGNPIPEIDCKAVMLARLNTLMQGFAGIHPDALILIKDLINKNISPVIYEHGGLGATTVVKFVSKVISKTSASAVSLLTAASLFRTLTIASTATTTLIKKAQLTKSVIVTSVTTLTRSIGKIIDSGVETVSVLILKIALHLVALSYVVTTTASISKEIGKTLTTSLTNTVAVVRSVYKNIAATVINTIVLTINSFYYKVLSVTSSVTTTLSRTAVVFLTLTVNVVSSTIDLIKEVSKSLAALSTIDSTVSTATVRFVLLVTTVYSSVVSSTYQVLTNVVDTIFVPTRKVLVKAVGFVSILVRPKKTNVVASKQDDIYG